MNFSKLYRNGPIWTLTLHRPEVYNALNSGLIHEIREVAEAAQIDDEVRVLVINGTNHRLIQSTQGRNHRIIGRAQHIT